MKNKFKFLATMLIGILLSTNVWGADVVAYTLTPATGTNNSYTGNCDVEINDITWNLTGNSTMLPWRLGGKSITNTYRDIYSKTAISDKITKVEVTNGTNSGSISVGEIRLIVSTNQNGGGTVKSTLTASYSANTTATFTCPDGVDWSECYYKISYKITVSGSSNKYVEFSEAKFYKAAATPTITMNANLTDFTYEAGSGPSAEQSFTVGGSNLTANITVTAPTNFEVSKSSESGYASSVSLTPATGTVSNTTIYVRMKSGLSQGTGKGGNITLSSTGATSQTIAVVGTVSAPAVKHKVNWYVNGTKTKTDEVAEGAAITFPADPSVPAACEEKSFYGWAKSAIDGEAEDAPTIYTSETMGTADIDFYAVFADKEGEGENGWEKVTTVAGFIPGTYVFGYESNDGFIPMRKETDKTTINVNTYLRAGTTAGSSSASTLTLTAETDVAAYAVTIGAGSAEGTITIHNGTNYIGVGSSSGNIHNEETAEDWKPAISNDVLILKHNTSVAYIFSYNTSSPRFAAYTSSQGKPSFYKWTSNTSYSAFVTSCAAYTVTFKSNGADVTSVPNVAPGQQVTAPTLAEIKTQAGAKNACTNYLVGWSTDSHYTNPSAAPSDILKPNAEGKITIPSDITGDVTYYAVYADVVGE